MEQYCIGIDLGGTSTKLGLFTVSGMLEYSWSIPTDNSDGGSHILPNIATAVKTTAADRHLSMDQLTGIGIGVPGPVDADGYLPHAANLGWGDRGINICEELEALTGLRTVAANDANIAALGEVWRGAASGCSNAVMITLGTGVGGGIIINRRIISGVHGAGGEIGHMHIGDDIPGVCGCGKTGCLEQVASATGLVRLAQEAGISGIAEARDVLDRMKSGDELCAEVVDSFAGYLGTAIAILAAVLDPEVVVIGGGVSQAGPVLIDYIHRHYMRKCFRSNRELRLVLAELGNDAGIYGGARLALDTFEGAAL